MTDEREESLGRTRAAWAKIEARHAESDELGVPPLRKFARVWPPRLRRSRAGMPSLSPRQDRR